MVVKGTPGAGAVWHPPDLQLTPTVLWTSEEPVAWDTRFPAKCISPLHVISWMAPWSGWWRNDTGW